MDIDGVDAQVLYPNLGIGPLFLLDDLELQFACLRAYNDFLSEFCSTDPNRLIGIGLVPTDDVEDRRRGAQALAKLQGLRGAMLPTYPRGEPLNSSTLRAAVADGARTSALPMHIHLRTGARHTEGLFGAPGDLRRRPLTRCSTSPRWPTTRRCRRSSSAACWSTHPKLKFVSVEGNIGWLGYFLEKSDRTYKRHRHWTKLDLPNPPSYYFHRQVLTRPSSRTRSA